MTVVLNMICRDEERVIARALRSCLPYVDCYCIVDTGSQDRTREVIREVMADVPGELYERPWVDQQHNRNEAMALARPMADYILCIDADEYLEPQPGFEMPPLTADFYELNVRMRGIEFARPMILRSTFEWQWKGTRHPSLSAVGAGRPGMVQGLINMAPPKQGASWADPKKYERHAVELRGQVEQSSRQWYYLAQSYRDSGDDVRAIWAYEIRAEMGGWAEEVWSALFEAAKCRHRLKYPAHEVAAAYQRACIARPQRAEAWFALGQFLRRSGQYAAALPFARTAAELPRPPDRLFVEFGVYEWAALDALSVTLSKLGLNEEAAEYAHRALERAPEGQRARILANLDHMEKAA